MGFIGSMFRVIITVAMIAAVAVVGFALYLFLSQNLNVSAVTGSASKSNQPVTFTIRPGENVTQIVDNLQKDGIIDNTLLFTAKLKMSGKGGNLKAGRFQVTPGMDWDRLIATLTTAPVDIGQKFTIIEGTRIEETAEKLSAVGIVSATRFMQLAGTGDGAVSFNNELVSASGKPADQGLQGYLFPDTYEIKQSEGDNSEAIIKLMLNNMADKFTPDMRKAAADKGRSIHQLLTVASIVQREGQLKEELPAIAAVFWNRLDKDMLLGADPTTQYALGKSPQWWPVLNLDPNTVDSPYNTYRVHGLPPGPICNPGLDAITAAVYPAETDYLYFVAKNDGTGGHAFATTLEEHERNRVIYHNK